MNKSNFHLRNVVAAAACLATTTLFAASCGGNANRQQMAEAETGAAEVQEAGGQPLETLAQEQEPEPVREKIDWMSGDFKLELEEVLNVPAMVITGISGEKVRKTAVKVKDRLYYTTTEGGLKQIVYRIENGAVVSYLLVPAAKTGVSTVSGWSSLEAILKSELEASVWNEPRNPDEMIEAGTEEIAGIRCVVYKIDDDKAAERQKEFEKEADGWAALTKALGGDAKQLDAMKKQFGGVLGGTATWWVDPTRQKFVARRHIDMKGVNGKDIDMVTHNVTFFEAGDRYASEIPDLNEYTIQK